MGFQDVAFLPSRACFPPHFLKIVVEVKALGPLHVIKLWLGYRMACFLLNTFAATKFFCAI